MSTIIETINQYEVACKEESLNTHPYVLNQLETEKKSIEVKPKSSIHLDLSGNNKLLTEKRIEDFDVIVLYKAFRNNLFITSIDLRYNNITDDGSLSIAKLIEETVTLQHLNLMCNNIGETGAKCIAKSLHKNETLLELHLNGNKINNTGGMCFAQALQINSTLEFLDLGDTDLQIESLIALATVLKQNDTLKSLNVNRPILFTHQEEQTVHFSNMLRVNSTLKELHLKKIDMRDFGITRIAESLSNNFCVTHLDLSCNRITRDGVKELTKLLSLDTPLKVLDLGNNRIEDAGAVYLAEALSSMNSTLTTLGICSNNIRGRGLCAIADCLKRNTSLVKLYIWGNDLEESSCIAFSNLIKTGRLELKFIDVEPYTVDGIIHLAQLSHGVDPWYYWKPYYGEANSNN